jgi:hypothetical protein
MRNVQRLGFTLVLGCFTISLTSRLAKAEDFYFSFANDPVVNPSQNGGVTGTVTGIIEGLPANGTGPASDVVILTVPDGLKNPSDAPLPLDTGTVWPAGDVHYNSFTVSNGQITAASFYDFSDQFSTDSSEQLEIDDPGQPTNDPTGVSTLTLDSNETSVYNQNGLAGVQFTAVPEPASIGIATFAIPVLLRRRKRSVQTSSDCL